MPNNGVTERHKFAFMAKVLKNEQVPEALRKEAAGLLVASGWMDLLPGVEEDVRKLLKDEAEQTRGAELFGDGLDLLTDDRS